MLVHSHDPHSMRSRIYETVRGPSVRPSVCLSQRGPTAANPLLQVCSELSMGWVDPWVGLGWVGLGSVGSKFYSFWWVGLGPLQQMY